LFFFTLLRLFSVGHVDFVFLVVFIMKFDVMMLGLLMILILCLYCEIIENLMNVLIFWKVSIGFMQKSYGGKYYCLFGNRMWEDTHCCVAHARDEAFDQEAEQGCMSLSCTHRCSSSSGELLHILGVGGFAI
jgi:hypothetical protein